jgi:hypothetical protein
MMVAADFEALVRVESGFISGRPKNCGVRSSSTDFSLWVSANQPKIEMTYKEKKSAA